MLWCIYCREADDIEDKRQLNSKTHGEYLRSKKLAILLAGPLFDAAGIQHQGSLFIVESDSYESVKAFFYQDPFYCCGIWSSITIHAFRCSSAGQINL